MFDQRYDCVEMGAPSRFCPPISDYHATYLNLVRADTTWLIGLAFCFTGLLTAIQWQSLFPTLRDRLALASLPLSPLDIFWSKLTAAVAGFAAFVLALNVVPAVLFAWIVAGRWQQHSIGAQAMATFAAAAAASVFMFFGMLALQGLLLNLLPPRLFQRVSVYAQAALFTANVAALPFLWRQPSPVWWPPRWFAGLSEAMLGMLGSPNPDARYALYAVVLAPLLAILSYLASYHRYERLLIEAPGAKARNPQPWPAWLTLHDPHEQAIFAFVWKTLTRSRLHRLMLQAAAGLAIAWIVGAGDLGSRDSFPVVLVPLAVSVCLIAGLRYLFSVPSELRANWLFQISESEGRSAWMRAVDRFTLGCALVPVYASSLPAAIAVFGWWQALRVTLLGFFLALVVFEFLFRDWHKVPFTCSYLPGKRQLWQLLLAAFAALSYLGTATLVVHEFSGGWVTFAAAFPLLWGAWSWLHKRRSETWAETPLVYDDLPEPAVSSLHIDFERGSLESPQQPSAEVRVAHRPFWDAAEDDSRAAAPFFRPAGLLDDLRYELRLLRRNAALAATIVATLTVGIGMNVSVFTLLNAVAFRPHVPCLLYTSMTRLRRWIDATHGTRLELVRHFLADFFVSDLVTTPEQWRSVVIGVVSVLISAGILMIPMFDQRYDCVEMGAPSRFCPPISDYHATYLNPVSYTHLELASVCILAVGSAVESVAGAGRALVCWGLGTDLASICIFSVGSAVGSVSRAGRVLVCWDL